MLQLPLNLSLMVDLKLHHQTKSLDRHQEVMVTSIIIRELLMEELLVLKADLQEACIVKLQTNMKTGI